MNPTKWMDDSTHMLEKADLVFELTSAGIYKTHKNRGVHYGKYASQKDVAFYLNSNSQKAVVIDDRKVILLKNFSVKNGEVIFD